MENWRRYIPLYMRIFRAFWLYPCFLLVWVLCALCMGSFGEDVYMRIAAACFMPFVYFSVVRVFAEADCEGIARCEAACEGQGLLCRAWTVIRSRGFLIEIAMIGAFTLILPFEAGFFHLADVLFGGSMLPRALVKLLVLTARRLVRKWKKMI